MSRSLQGTRARNPELSVVLPAFNEGLVLETSLYHIDAAVRDSGVNYEIIVVDDGSLDNTKRKAAEYAQRNGHVKCIGYKGNMGKGYALRKGFWNAAGDVVVFVDSDLEIDAKQIGKYVEALKHGDVAIASKWHPESVVHIPLIRKILGHGFNVFVRLMTGLKLKDTQTGLKAMRREAFEKIFPKLAVKRYAFDVELLAVANIQGLRIVELPVNITLKASFRLREVWKMFIDLLGIAYRLRVLRMY